MATITTTSLLHTNPARPRSLTCLVCTPRPPGYEYCRWDRCIKFPLSNAVPFLHLFRSLPCSLHPSLFPFFHSSFSFIFQPFASPHFLILFFLFRFQFFIPLLYLVFSLFTYFLYFFPSSLSLPFSFSLHHHLILFFPSSLSLTFPNPFFILSFIGFFTLSIHPFLFSFPSSVSIPLSCLPLHHHHFSLFSLLFFSLTLPIPFFTHSFNIFSQPSQSPIP